MLTRSAAGLLAAALLALVAGSSGAVVRPFVYGGANGTSTETTEINLFEGQPPDWSVTVDHPFRSGWEAGAGARIFSRTAADGSPVVGLPPWEIRLRFGLGGGDLGGETISGTQAAFPGGTPFPFTSRESYSYRDWTLGAFFEANPIPWAGFYVGPSLQSVRIDAKRDWEGVSGCDECGDATDRSTTRYGLLEVGTQIRPFSAPVALEGYWIPKRFQLSTTHILESENWTTAVFPEFKRSFGFRLALDF